MKKEKKIITTLSEALEIGGKEWKKSDTLHRIYFEGKALENLLGLEISRYNSGSISSAKLDGEKISNSRAWKMLLSKKYFDVVTGTVV